MLIVREPDLSTTILITTLFITALFISGFSYKKFGIILGVLVPIVVAGVVYIQSPNQKLLKGYQLNRIMAFLNPDEFDDLRYQQNNAEMAIGSGQLYGKGLYNDSADSVKNGNYIAEPQTDFIFAIVGEEMGFIGSCIVIGLLLLITIESILTGSRAVDIPGKIICFGMAAITTFQTFINIGVVTSLLPNTGIPLPFVSYGLSSLITMFAGVGLVLSVRMTKKLSVEEAMNEHRFNCT
jgi:rod shape determining protein RodA